MTRIDLNRLDSDLERLVDRGLDAEGFRREAMARLLRAVPADGHCCSVVDPGTLVMTSHVTEGVPRAEAWRIYRNEYAQDDVSKHADLATGNRPVRILHRETAGDPSASPRYRDVIRPMGMEHELRAAAIDAGATWGFIHLFRAPGARPFDADEEAVVARASRRVAAGIRAAGLAGALGLADVADTPGMILIDPRGRVRMLSGLAESWLAALTDSELPAGSVPDVLVTLAEWAGELARRGAHGAAARARVRGAGGRWWTLHASCPTWTDGERGEVVVIVQPVAGAQLAGLWMQALGFTPGERQVLDLVLAGRSTKEIASGLHLSPWTVQDRLKGVFARAGVRSRRELVARLTGA
ncbi:MAG: helix-turn-helix transcriptional regulator [Miltoncostaeaceae bacterium]